MTEKIKTASPAEEHGEPLPEAFMVVPFSDRPEHLYTAAQMRAYRAANVQPKHTAEDDHEDALTVAYMAGAHDARRATQAPAVGADHTAVMRQALEALECVDLQSLVPDYGSGHYSVSRTDGRQVATAIAALRKELGDSDVPVQHKEGE